MRDKENTKMKDDQPRIIRAGRKVMAGSPLAPAPSGHPLGPPTSNGTLITVDTMLNQPTRITRMIMDLSLQRFIADRVFASAGGVSGGAVIYDQATLNELYAARDVERIAPGAEFPIITSERPTPQVAEVEKWGGKVWVSDEARDRNNSAALTNQVRQLTNTIVRKINARAIQVLEAAVTAFGQIVTGRNWQTYNPLGAAAMAPQLSPARDFAFAAQLAEQDELGVVYTLWILNPQEYTALLLIYQAGGLQQFLNALNLTIYVSNRVAPGTAYVVAGQQTGEMRLEKPLGTETWREPNRQRTWIQADVRPVMYVTNPYSIFKFVGLAG